MSAEGRWDGWGTSVGDNGTNRTLTQSHLHEGASSISLNVDPSTTEPRAIGRLAAAYKADSLSQADNTPVTALNDSSEWPGQPNTGVWDLVQATGSKQPTYQTNEINGRPILRFDGNDNLVHPAFNPLNGLSSYSGALVVKANDPFGVDNWVWESEQRNVGIRITGNELYVYIGASNFGKCAFTTGFHIIRWIYDGTLTGNANRLKVWVDGTSQTLAFTGTIPASLNSEAGMRLGANVAESAGLAGDLAEALLWVGALTTSGGDVPAEADLVDAYLGSKYGITISTIPTYVIEVQGGPEGVVPGQAWSGRSAVKGSHAEGTATFKIAGFDANMAFVSESTIRAAVTPSTGAFVTREARYTVPANVRYIRPRLRYSVQPTALTAMRSTYWMEPILRLVAERIDIGDYALGPGQSDLGSTNGALENGSMEVPNDTATFPAGWTSSGTVTWEDTSVSGLSGDGVRHLKLGGAAGTHYIISPLFPWAYDSSKSLFENFRYRYPTTSGVTQVRNRLRFYDANRAYLGDAAFTNPLGGAQTWPVEANWAPHSGLAAAGGGGAGDSVYCAVYFELVTTTGAATLEIDVVDTKDTSTPLRGNELHVTNFTGSALDARGRGNGATFDLDTSSPLRLNSGLVLGQAALATGATAGFAYLPSMAGKPTGTPTTQTGTVPVVFDTTSRVLWAYIGGAWAAVWGEGTSFPASPYTGMEFNRTDLRITAKYDGTHWVGPSMPVDWLQSEAPDGPYTGTADIAFAALFSDRAVKLERWSVVYLVTSGNHNATDYWKLQFWSNTAADGYNQHADVNTNQSTVGLWVKITDVTSFSNNPLATTDRFMKMRVEKQGAAGPLQVMHQLRFREIYT